MSDYLSNPTIRDRFWARVQKTDTCWLWTGATSKAGYGQIGYSRTGRVYTHRLSYELHFGAIPDKAVIRHTCDTPACVNPGHLLIGTQRDNVADMFIRQRQNTHSHLTELQVRDVVARYIAGELTPIIAASLGVRRNEINRIIRGERWSHLWTPEEIAERQKLIKQRRGYDIWRQRRQCSE